MSAVERLQAAIEKLEALKRASDDGPWTIGDESPTHADLFVVACEGGNGDVTDYIDRGNAYLIVTLYRTLDAQLAILRDSAERYSKFPPAREPDWQPKAPSTVNALALADAINGGA